MVSPDKKLLRERMRSTRRAIEPANRATWGLQIRDRVLGLGEIARAASVFAYVSHQSEVPTHELIRELLRRGKVISVPKIVDRAAMNAVQIAGLDPLRENAYGILEPAMKVAFGGTIDVCLTPGLAFTPSGDRLGYGRGYYDRFLAEHPRSLAVAPAFECQLVEHLPTEPHDRPMDVIVTESRLIRVKAPGETLSGG